MRRWVLFGGFAVSCGWCGIAAAQDAPAIIRLEPSEVPPSRTYCTIEDSNGRFHSTVDWDPLVPGPLTRDVRVPSRVAVSSLRASCYSEPIRPTIKPDTNFAWEFIAPKDIAAGCASGSQGACATLRNDRQRRADLAGVDAAIAEIDASALALSEKPKSSAPDLGSQAATIFSQHRESLLRLGVDGGAVSSALQQRVQDLRATPTSPTAALKKERDALAAEIAESERKQEVESALAELLEEFPLVGPRRQLLFQVKDRIMGANATHGEPSAQPYIQVTRVDAVEDSTEGLSDKDIATTTLSGGGLRSLGLPSEAAVNEVFQAIAEVVVEKAKDRGMRVLASHLTKELCAPGAGFPRVCDALQRVRLEDLQASGQMLEEAAIQDVVSVALEALPADLPLKNDLGTAIQAAIDLGSGRGERARGAGVALVLGTLDALAKSEPDLRIVGRIVVECHKSGSCDAQDIRARLHAPRDYYSVSGKAELPDTVTWDGAAAFIETALLVLKPKADTTEAQQLRAAMGLALDVVDRYCSGPLRTKVCAEKTHLRWVAYGLVDRDMSRIVAGGIALLESQRGKNEHLERIAELTVALSSFLNVPTTSREPTADERAARKEQREKALSTLIDEFGSRRHRRGDWVASLGSTLAINPVTLAYRPGADSSNRWTYDLVPISLTVALGADYHCRDGWGFHADLAPVDIGGYLSVQSAKADASDKDWAARVAPGDALRPKSSVGVSYLFQDADLLWVAVLSGGYAPKLTVGDGRDTVEKHSNFFFGLSTGVYIPIFDLN